MVLFSHYICCLIPRSCHTNSMNKTKGQASRRVPSLNFGTCNGEFLLFYCVNINHLDSYSACLYGSSVVQHPYSIGVLTWVVKRSIFKLQRALKDQYGMIATDVIASMFMCTCRLFSIVETSSEYTCGHLWSQEQPYMRF